MARIPHATWILVCDGRIALILRNDGDETFPNLKTVGTIRNDDNPPTHELGSERPGRSFDRITERRSTLEQTDWHDEAEHRFARRAAREFEARAAAENATRFIVVAPPRTLADLRATFSKATRHRILLELDKDLTRFPLHEIEAHLLKAA